MRYHIKATYIKEAIVEADEESWAKFLFRMNHANTPFITYDEPIIEIKEISSSEIPNSQDHIADVNKMVTEKEEKK